MRNTFFAALLAFCGMVTAANATPLDTVNTTDDIYGGFSGSIDSSATGSAAELTWKSAGYYWTGDIDLTTASGKIIADINTNDNDTYTLYGENSGYATIGTDCVDGGGTVCVVATGAPQSLYSAVNSVNGGEGNLLRWQRHRRHCGE